MMQAMPARRPRRSVAEILEHSDRLFARQMLFLPLWQAAAEVFYPERADFTTRITDGAERFEHMYHSAPYRMRRDLANTWGSLLRPYGTDWARLVAEPDMMMSSDGVRLWCEGATKRQFRAMYDRKSQFVRAFAESDNDYITFGQSVVAVSDNRDRTGLFFRCVHPRDVAFNESVDGEVDEVHERIEWTTRQCEQMFGMDALPKEMQDACEKEPLRKWQLVRAVVPSASYDGGVKLPAAMQWASLYIERSLKTLLGTTGFKVFPYNIRRWMTVSGETYARSPITGVALADGRTLNVAERALMESIEKQVDPPLLASSETIVGDVQLYAGGVTYIDREYDVRQGGPAVEALKTGSPEYGLKYSEASIQALGAVFYENKLWLPSARDGAMTAFEVRSRLEEYARTIAPIVQPEEAHLSQLMDICFQRLLNNQVFEPWPEELDDAEIRFEFETAAHAARARLKAEEAGQVILAVAQAEQLWPGAKDHVDSDRMTRDALAGIGPQSWIRAQKNVDAMRQSAEEEQSAQQAAELAAAMGGAANGGKPQLTAPASPAFPM